MELKINFESKDDIYEFCDWLKLEIFQYLLDTVDRDKLERFDKIIQSTLVDTLTNKATTNTAWGILVAAMSFLKVKHRVNFFTLEIDDSQVIPNTNAKFIDIVRLINYGNLNVAAYDIVDKVFDHFAENINEYYNKFLEES